MCGASPIGSNGTVYYSTEVSANASRLPIEGRELAGSPVAGFPFRGAMPQADRQEIHFEVTVKMPIGSITLTDDETATLRPAKRP